MTVPSGRREVATYAVAIAVLVGLGVLLRSYVLNWIVGPLLGVVLVAAVARAADRLLGPPS